MENLIIPLVVVGIVGLILLVWWCNTLGKLSALRAQVREAVGALASQLRQRFDLIPDSLTAAREGVAAEMQYLKGILDTRRDLARPAPTSVDPDAPVELVPVLQAMSGGGGRSVTESNPTAGAPAALYQQFMKVMASTEKDVTAARRFVEAAIGEYNAGINAFPAFIVARVHGLTALKNTKITKKLATKPNYFA